MTRKMKTTKNLLLLLFLLLCSCTHAQEVITENWQNAIKELPEGKDPTPAELWLKDRLEKSKHFEKYVNSNGIETYVLKTHLAKQQSTMYFTTPGITSDGRYMWFWLKEDNKNSLALVDFEKDEVVRYADMEIAESSSVVDTITGDVYWVEPRGSQRHTTDFYKLYRRSPGDEETISVINKIPHFVDNCKPPRQVVTHLMFSADHKSFCFDSGHYYVNNKTYLGVITLDGSSIELWTALDRRYNHAQMNPKYNDVMLAVQDYFYDYLGQYGEVGSKIPIENRMWIIYSDGEAKPVFPVGNDIYHEWWDSTGDILWYIDKKGNYGGKGVCRVPYDYKNRSFGNPELIWPNSLGHAECDSRSLYLVADHGHKTFETSNSVRVSFFNIATGKEVDIVTSMPYPGWNADPHPHFALQDRIICFTFSETEGSTVGITFTGTLEELTK